MKKNIIILFVVSALMLSIIGCQVSVDKQEEPTQITSIEETSSEIVVESTEQETIVESKGYDNAEDWVDSLELDTPTILIWNDENNEMTILEDNQEYQLKENDEILLTIQGRLDDFYCMPINVFEKFEPVKQKYVELFLNIEGKQEVTIETEIADKEYVNTVTFIGISGETEEPENIEEGVMVKEDIDVSSTLPGEEWIASIGNEIEDAFIAIWNDTDGTKKILENGEKYQLKDDDVFFLYLPELAMCIGSTPLEVSEKVTFFDNGQTIDLNVQEEVLVTFTIDDIANNFEREEVSCILYR